MIKDCEGTALIVARQVDYSHLSPGLHWEVLFFSDEPGQGMFPIGTAYVVAIPGVGAQLNYILVADQWRRRGIAHRLIEECRRKWPGMQATNPMNAQAEKLLSKAGLIMSDAVNVRRE